MRLTQLDRLGFSICAVLRLHQRSEGHRDDLLGLPAVWSCTGDLRQLEKIPQNENTRRSFFLCRMFSQLIGSSRM